MPLTLGHIFHEQIFPINFGLSLTRMNIIPWKHITSVRIASSPAQMSLRSTISLWAIYYVLEIQCIKTYNITQGILNCYPCTVEELAPYLPVKEHTLSHNLYTVWSANSGYSFNHLYQGLLHVPNPAWNGKRPRSRTNWSAQTLTRRDASSPPTHLCQSASIENAGRRAWERSSCHPTHSTQARWLAEKSHQICRDMSGVWAILQATIGQTSEGTWIRRTVVSRQVWHATDTTFSRQRHYRKTEGNRATFETVGEGSDVSQGTGEATGADSDGTEAKDGESARLGRA